MDSDPSINEIRFTYRPSEFDEIDWLAKYNLTMEEFQKDMADPENVDIVTSKIKNIDFNSLPNIAFVVDKTMVST